MRVNCLLLISDMQEEIILIHKDYRVIAYSNHQKITIKYSKVSFSAVIKSILFYLSSSHSIMMNSYTSYLSYLKF